MCYPKPGPRCSAHAKEALNKALGTGTSAQILKAQDEYDETLGGQSSLKDLLVITPLSERDRAEVQARLASGITRRALKLEALNRHVEETNATKRQTQINRVLRKEQDGILAANTPVSDAQPEEFLNSEQYRNVRKMPALFVIDRSTHSTTEEINEKAAWIFDEPSTPTIKRDGTSITVTEDGKIYARRSVKAGKTAPDGFLLAEVDPITGHSFGLEPIEQSSFSKVFKQAARNESLTPGTYELCGPRVNGNPERLGEHKLLAHGSDIATEIPDMRTVPREQAFETLRTIFAQYKERGIEGVVWHGEGGKRTKLRVKDFFGDPSRR